MLPQQCPATQKAIRIGQKDSVLNFPTLLLLRKSNKVRPTTPTFLSEPDMPPPTKPVVYSPVPTWFRLQYSKVRYGRIQLTMRTLRGAMATEIREESNIAGSSTEFQRGKDIYFSTKSYPAYRVVDNLNRKPEKLSLSPVGRYIVGHPIYAHCFLLSEIHCKVQNMLFFIPLKASNLAGADHLRANPTLVSHFQPSVSPSVLVLNGLP